MYIIQITLSVEMQRKSPMILSIQSTSTLVSRNCRLDYEMLPTKLNPYYDQHKQASMHSFSAYFEGFIINHINQLNKAETSRFP